MAFFKFGESECAISEFLCMSPHEVMAALRQQACSVDAGCVIAQGVLGSDIALQSP